MAKKVLGQLAPSATTLTTLYTVPGGKSSVCSTLTVCNRAGNNVNYRVAVRPAGASISNEHYFIYDATIPPWGTDFITIGLTLAATDVVSVYAATNELSFAMFGDES